MAILIKNMKMPEEGKQFVVTVENGTWIFQERWEPAKIFTVSEIPSHGNLIDIDALDIYRREEQAQEDINQSPFSEYLEGLKDGLHEAAKCLSTAPIIIKASKE